MINVTVAFSWSVSTATKYISSVSLPVQGVKGASSTHTFINESGSQILHNDGYSRAAHLFRIFAGQLDGGVVWIDKGLKSTCHHYDPDTGGGMWLWPSAAEKCLEFFNRALALWRDKKHARAMFFLGASAHLVQDVCVPHHASCKVFSGHRDYESWVEKRKDNYRVDRSGIYDIAGSPEEWVAENARQAKDCYDLVSKGSPEEYHQATQLLLPYAQRTTAGFLLHFYRQL
ncbi:MAG: phospholipase C zinc-binding protein [Peptococcaceae bacterium BRH_c4b]|nr:MAG: phospholipase C zinc-binding protein [Peptococcaceae bacterium BRH_c4b]